MGAGTHADRITKSQAMAPELCTTSRQPQSSQEEETRLGLQMEHKTLCPALGRGCLGEMHIPHP